MRILTQNITSKCLLALTFFALASSANAQTVQFFNESAGPSTTPVSSFELPPPWSPASMAVAASVPVGDDKNESYGKLGVRIVGAGAGVQVSRVSCTGPSGTSYLIASSDGVSVPTDSGGVARFRMRGRQMVTPFGAPVRELSCDFLITPVAGSQFTRSLVFRGANYFPVELSLNGQATGVVQGEGSVPATLRNTPTWLPGEFSALTFAANRQIVSAPCVMANAPVTTASAVFSGVTNSVGVVQGVVTSQNLHVGSGAARSGTCGLSVVRLAGEIVPVTLPAAPPVVLTVQGSVWKLLANNISGEFPISVRGGGVGFQILLNGAGGLPSVGQTVIPDTSFACTAPSSTTTLSVSGTTTGVTSSFVIGGSVLTVNGPLNVANQSLTGKCRFRLQNHPDVTAEIGVRGQNICQNNPQAQPRHTACAAGVLSVDHQALVVDLASTDGVNGTYQGSVTATAQGAPTQICAAGRCVLDFPTNAQVTITATPAANAGVASWEYDCSADRPAIVSAVMVTMNQSRHCSLKFGPRASQAQLIGACPANYASQLYRLKLPSSECVTSIEAFEANLRAGIIDSEPAATRTILGFPVFSTVETTPGVVNGRVRMRIGLDYRGRTTDYFSPPAGSGTYVRPPFQGPAPEDLGSKALKLNYWPSPTEIAAVNAGCAAGASVFGFKCKSWGDEMARFVEARRSSGWCLQTMTPPTGVGATSVRSVRVPLAGMPGQTAVHGLRTTLASTPASFKWVACAGTTADATAPLVNTVPPDDAEPVGGDDSSSFICAEGFSPDATGNCGNNDAYKILIDGDNSPPATQEPECTRGNPCGPGTGNKSIHEMDFSYGAFSFGRNYNTKRQLKMYSSLGVNWGHTYSWRLMTGHFIPFHSISFEAGPTKSFVVFQNAMGQAELFRKLTTGVFRSEKTVGQILRFQADLSWKLYYPDGHQLWINALGLPTALYFPEDPGNTLTFVHNSFDQLVSVTDGRGRVLNFGYEAPAQVNGVALSPRFGANLERVSMQGTTLVAYEYDILDRLITARYQGNKTRQYKYAEAGYAEPMFRHHITGIINERGERYASYKYDFAGRVIDSWHGDNYAGRVQLNYVSDSEVQVTTAGGSGQDYVETFNFGDPLFRRPSGLSDPRGSTTNLFNYQDASCSSTGSPEWLCKQIDPRNIATRMSYDQFHLTKVEEDVRAANTATCAGGAECVARTVTTSWDDALNRVLTRENDGRKVSTSFVAGRVSTMTISDTRVAPSATAPRAPDRVTSYQYCDAADVIDPNSGCAFIGFVKAVDGPRLGASDVVKLSYYKTFTNTGCAQQTGNCALKGDLKSIENALGQRVEFTHYNTMGQLLRSVDVNGVSTSMTHHPRGWLITSSVTDPGNAAVKATHTVLYNDNGTVDKITDPDGVVVSFGYDLAQRLTRVMDASGNRIDYDLDAKGNRTSERVLDSSGALRRVLARQFDALGRLQATLRAPYALAPTAPGAVKSSFAYDSDNNLDTSTDALGTVTKMRYDGLNRLTETIHDYQGSDPGTANATSKMTYDANDNLLSVIDAMNLVTAYEYDGINQARSENSPDTKNTQMSFDAAGNLVSKTDARGVIVTSTFDVLNRLVSASYSGASVSGTSAGEAYFYDEANASTGCAVSYPTGRMTRTLDASGGTTYCYDWRGNVIKKAQTMSARNRSLSVEYSYTLADRLKTITYPSGVLVSYTRNPLGQVTGVNVLAPGSNRSQSIVTNATYEPFGPLKWMQYASATTVTTIYDQNYQPTLIDSKSGLGLTQLSLAYSYDDIGRAGAIAQTTSLTATTQYYSYDRAHRLKESRDTPSPGSGTIEQYSYDLVGNRLSAKQGSGAAETYRYNNQASAPVLPSDPNYASKSHRLNGFGSTDSRSYDATGNLAFSFDLQRTLRYNPRGELTNSSADACLPSAKICFGDTRYSYNASGERVSKETPYTSNLRAATEGAELAPAPAPDPTRAPQANRYEGYALFDEAGQLLVDQTIHVTQTPCGNCRDPYVEYIYLNGMPIAALNDPNGPSGLTVTELYDDHLGTPRQANTAGTQSWSWENVSGNSASGGGNSFGNQANTGSGINLRFPGQQYDWQTGLNYNYMRFYEPRTGRYITSDPIGIAGGASTYAYAGNNPISNSDPSGLFFTSVDAACVSDPGLCFEILGYIADANAATATDPDKKAYWEAVSGLSCEVGNIADKVSILTGVAVVAKVGVKLAKIGVAKIAERAAAKAELRLAAEACCCFAPGTLIYTANGLVAIELLRVGDKVWARDAATGETTLKPVTELFVTRAKPLYALTTQAADGTLETIEVTDNHPYWVIGTGWVDSGVLKPGMRIENFERGALVVESLVALNKNAVTYNFTVGDFHTYFVGGQRALVHNCTGVCSMRTLIESPEATKEISSLSESTKKQLDKVLEAIARNEPGFREHALGGDRAGQMARNIPGTGKGTGAGRVIYQETRDGAVEILKVTTKHDYK
jgi:RHS repeat-associated protein